MTKSLCVTAVVPAAPGLLQVTWDDGVTRLVDLRGQLHGHVPLDMLNIAEVFRDVTVVPGGGGVEWANGADFSARSLRLWSVEDTDLNERKSA